MADLRVYPDRLEIALTRTEKLLARRRDDVVVPRSSISSVAITDDPWIWIRGIRAPGVLMPLTLAIGTWKFHGGTDFLLIKGKQRSAVVIDLDGAGDELEIDDVDLSVSDLGVEPAAASATAETAADSGFVRLIVSTSHATKLIEALRLAGSDGDVDGPLID